LPQPPRSCNPPAIPSREKLEAFTDFQIANTSALTVHGFNTEKDLLIQLLFLNQQAPATIENGSPVTAHGVPKNYPGVKKLVTEDQGTCFMKTDLLGQVEIQSLHSDRPHCGFVRHSTRPEPRSVKQGHAYQVQRRSGIGRDKVS